MKKVHNTGTTPRDGTNNFTKKSFEVLAIAHQYVVNRRPSLT